jgi:5'(3')-deoxyribonucleotidase
MARPILFIDMDMVLVDFHTGWQNFNRHHPRAAQHYLDTDTKFIPGIYRYMDPMSDAIPIILDLAMRFRIFFVSSVPSENHTAYVDKLEWLQRHFGRAMPDVAERFIATPRKDLLRGDYLIDDGYEAEKHGIREFQGTLLLFGEGHAFGTWVDVEEYFASQV